MSIAKRIAVLSSVGLAACGSETLGPPVGPLRLEGTIGRASIQVGDTTSLVFRLRNVSHESLTLNFSNSCQIMPYITAGASDKVVYPGGGAWGCYLVLTSFTLAPGAERVVSVLVRGGEQATASGVPLLPGQYQAYAQLEHPDFPVRSASVSLRVE